MPYDHCRCLQPLILLLDSTPCPALPGLVDPSTGAEIVPGGAALAAAAAAGPVAAAAAAAGTKLTRQQQQPEQQRRLLVAQLLVGEVVLATKEVRLAGLL